MPDTQYCYGCGQYVSGPCYSDTCGFGGQVTFGLGGLNDLAMPDPLEGTKLDDGKSRWDLAPMDALEIVMQVITHGANKYGDNNWRKLKNLEPRFRAAALRHISAHARGIKLDDETGLPHLAHAACSLLFIMQAEQDSIRGFLSKTIASQVVKRHRCPNCGAPEGFMHRPECPALNANRNPEE